MAHLKLVLVFALASQNGIAMQTDSQLPSPTVLRVVGGVATIAAAGAFYYGTKLANANCPPGGDAFEQGGLGAFLCLTATIGLGVAAGIAFLAADAQTHDFSPAELLVAEMVCKELRTR